MSVVGLTLGSHNFRAVEMERSKGKVVLKRYGTYENPKVTLDSEDPKDLGSYSAALGNFFSEMGFGTKNVIVSLPERQVFVRTVQLPNMTEKDLSSSIRYEAEQYIPLPMKEVTLSYQMLDVDVAEKDKMNVLLVAARKNVVLKYIDILKKANLTPKGLEPETLAMSRALGDDAAKTYASIIVDINVAQTLIILTYKGFVRLTRNISVGGESLTRAVQQELNLDYTQAEEYKKTYGLDESQVEGKIYAALAPVFDKIIAEIKRSKVFFTTHNPNVMINKVIVSGGTALMPGLLLYMVNHLDVEVELANPWKNVTFSSKIEPQKDDLLRLGPVFATPVGLAMKEI